MEFDIEPSLAVGNHVLEFLRNEGKRKGLKWRTMYLRPREMNESDNDNWVEANFGKHRGNVLEPLLGMLRKGGILEVPDVNETSDIEYYYEIDSDEDQLSINHGTNDVQIFDLKSLPGSKKFIIEL